MAAPISNEEQVFITELGRRITALRKDAGMTQTQVAQALNVSQQAVQAWEAGRRRIQISILPAVARLLAVSLEDLLGEEPEKIARKRGPAPKWQQLIEEIDSLPKAKQKMISEMLSALIIQARN
ncbi:TPA: helix-turn-helix transcriptional regulator [Escherichia coli]|uniref:helix-turn-helix domain-containing protein n=1 Tax=Escherichia coli TaxID=562 RepID=UPI000B4907F4|nr:helix-turn-helix transcriptional regulator [Escherichia coli]EER2598440.1 helix-turn-helix transcriptional regulator [Escherichia coli]EHH3929784.1 helix-turn-helix transcriptional regulator [Escherichia coli]EID8069435.1 helix-turn-helix transcriptional regulator [Escherichia coli]EJE8383940.1 helix-turn-helix transcriptional regulator [Escherichia coli]EKA0956684.1 helix-turn-helix transcriptional regulator [Escherichia coli]